MEEIQKRQLGEEKHLEQMKLRMSVPWVSALGVSACWRLCDNAGWLVHCPLVKNEPTEWKAEPGEAQEQRRDAPLYVPGASLVHQ